MPARTDHDSRRRDVSAAVWRVLATQGFGGLTLRAVATEMGASTGLLTHYFPTKRALVHYALDVAEERSATVIKRRPCEPGLPGVRAAILDVLPLTPEMEVMSRVWVSSWDGALADPELRAAQVGRYDRWRERLRVRLADAPLPPTVSAEVIAAFAHGLVVQALFDPDQFPPDRQIAIVDDFVSSLRRPLA